MVTCNATATNLADLYAQLVAAQKQAHGEDYVLHHDVIRNAHDCTSYLELGIRQGTTLACALLAGFPNVTGVDRDLGPWREYAQLFWSNWPIGGHFDVYERDSREPFAWLVDFLFIDTYHTAAHLRAELVAHHANVQRHILVHDTAAHPEMHYVIEQFVSEHPEWLIAKREIRNVGFTLCSKRS